MTVAEAKQRFTYREFVEWLLFESIDPPPERRNEIMLAKLISCVISLASKRRVHPKNILPQYDRIPEPLDDPEKVRAAYERLFAAMKASGAKFVEGQKKVERKPSLLRK